MEVEGVVQPFHRQLHPVGAVGAGGIHLCGGDAGAVDPLLEQMRLTGDMVLPQRCKEEQGPWS